MDQLETLAMLISVRPANVQGGVVHQFYYIPSFEGAKQAVEFHWPDPIEPLPVYRKDDTRVLA